MATLLDRAIGAARLDVATYEEIEHDPTAFGQAMAVVVIATVANGLGSAATSSGGVAGLLGGAIGAVIGWFAWAFIIYVVGTRVLPAPETKADFGQLLRTLGFAAAPGVVGVLGVVPLVGGIAVLVAGIWQLAAMVVAVRQALDYTTTGRAVAVCLIGFVAQVVIVMLFAMLLGGALFGASATLAP